MTELFKGTIVELNNKICKEWLNIMKRQDRGDGYVFTVWRQGDSKFVMIG